MKEEFWLKETTTQPPVAVIEAGGRLNSQAARDLHLRCEALYDAGCTQVVIKMSDVTFIASSGVGTLEKLTCAFLEKGGVFQLAAVPSPVMRVIDLLDRHQFLDIATDVAEALGKLKSMNAAG